MKNVVCPHCGITHVAIKDDVESAQGSVRCPRKRKGFGWNLRDGKVEILC